MSELITLQNQDFSDIIQSGSEKDLQKLLGMEETSSETNLARLSINYATEDDDDNSLPRGHYRLYDPATKTTVYAKDAKIRPFVRTFMYNVWDNEESQFSCRTVQCKSMGDAFYDTSGGEKCGRLTKQEIEGLANDSPVLIQQKSIKCTQVIYGLATIAGQTATKEDKALENIPAVWYVKGASFIPVADWFKSIDKQKKLYATVIGKLETVKQKRGGNQFWISRATSVDKKDFTKKDRGLLETFVGEIVRHNAEIMNKHSEAKKAMDGEGAELLDALDASAA
tara:strand:- start:150 stop:995 length:846 start_codon:yes stop_codon:yes gene_type:complete